MNRLTHDTITLCSAEYIKYNSIEVIMSEKPVFGGYTIGTGVVKPDVTTPTEGGSSSCSGGARRSSSPAY
jgi:hypothetical protein